MMLENRGNTQASCRLHLVDPSGRVEAEFDPPAAGVEPGASTLVRMKVRTTGMQWQRHARTVPFRIDADQPGSPTATAPATFVQTPVVPEHLIGRLVGRRSRSLAVLLAWVAAWSSRPSTTPPTRAVDEAVPETTTTLEPTVDSLTGITVATAVPDDDKGTIINMPLPCRSRRARPDADQLHGARRPTPARHRPHRAEPATSTRARW